MLSQYFQTFLSTPQGLPALVKTLLAAVGFEPTPPERLEPKSSALDHSATLPCFFFLLFHPPEIEATLAAEIFHKNHRVAAKESSLLGYGSHKSLPRRCSGSGGIRTHAPEETGALIPAPRPLGHATRWGWFPRAAFHQSFPCRSLPLANALKFSTVGPPFCRGMQSYSWRPPFLRSAGLSLIKHTWMR